MKKMTITILIGLLSFGAFAVGENANTAGSATKSCCETGACGGGMPMCFHKRSIVEKVKEKRAQKKAARAARTKGE